MESVSQKKKKKEFKRIQPICITDHVLHVAISMRQVHTFIRQYMENITLTVH